jgi:hypothetical protein
LLGISTLGISGAAASPGGANSPGDLSQSGPASPDLLDSGVGDGVYARIPKDQLGGNLKPSTLNFKISETIQNTVIHVKFLK